MGANPKDANPASIHSYRAPRGDYTWGAYLNPKGLQLLRTKLHVEGGGRAVVVHAEHQEHLAIEGFCKSPKESWAQLWHGFFSKQRRNTWQREGWGTQTTPTCFKWTQNPTLDISKNITKSFGSSTVADIFHKESTYKKGGNPKQVPGVSRDKLMLWSSAG